MVKILGKLLIGLIATISVTQAQAEFGWSGCVDVTAVTDYRGYDGAVYLSVSPEIPGCKYGGIDRVRIKPGLIGATDDTAKGALSIGIAAQLTGKKVQFYFDDSTVQCNVQVVSLAGHSGQCK